MPESTRPLARQRFARPWLARPWLARQRLAAARGCPAHRPVLLLAAFGALSASACASAPTVERPIPTSGQPVPTVQQPVPSGGQPIPTAEPPVSAADDAATTGVLVMAHGGGAEWNAAVAEAVAPLRDRIPLVLALGMADPRTLQAGLDSLAAQGANDVAVVRLFLSGDSFLHQTQYLFGLRSDPPPWGMIGHRMTAGTDLRPLATDATVLVDPDGLAGSRTATGIMEERAEAAASERDAGLLLVAHGMGAEDQNDRLLAAMERSAEKLRTAGHPEVRTATLREDWAEARTVAEQGIRAAVEEMREKHGRVVVLPYRLYGFGPYADVLRGLAYDSGPALLPHSLITEWIAERATSRFCSAGLPSPLASCALSANPARARKPIPS